MRSESWQLSREYCENPDLDHLSSLPHVSPYSYYHENIFSPEDFFLYRAIFNLYGGNTTKAISDLERSAELKQMSKDENENSDSDSESSNQTDLSDIGLCSLNIHERQYNIMVCHLVAGQFPLALSQATSLIETAPIKYSRSLFLLRALLYQELDESVKSHQDFNRAFDEDNENAVKYFDLKQTVTIDPFPQSSRLCSQFPNF